MRKHSVEPNPYDEPLVPRRDLPGVQRGLKLSRRVAQQAESQKQKEELQLKRLTAHKLKQGLHLKPEYRYSSIDHIKLNKNPLLMQSVEYADATNLAAVHNHNPYHNRKS